MNILRRTVSIAVLVLAASLSRPVHADDPRAVALVIGLSDYEDDALDLPNPVYDARAMDDLLGNLGFDVTRVLNRDADKMREEIADFITDAAGATVALVYYAGHGIEVGGENYLVSTDADISTPASAGASLVAVDDVLSALERSVPITIALLDACRTNPFPDGTMLQLSGSDVAVAPAPVGLGAMDAMRGPSPVNGNGLADSHGVAIGFAASAGQQAKDGRPGDHSPYVAALLKHLAEGYEVDQLMKIVRQEVYLKTDGDQRPFYATSLLPAVTFGVTKRPAGGDVDVIKDGRGKLLLSIESMDVYLKGRVEAAAHRAVVPMDAIYGLLTALGEDVPKDPGELEKLLNSQAETIKKIMAEHEALHSRDPEVERLAAEAKRAFDEGLVDLSVKYWEEANARLDALDPILDADESALEARRREQAAAKAELGNGYVAAGRLAEAAVAFDEAFEKIQRWDRKLASSYKRSEADTLWTLGDRRGDNAALARSLVAYREALTYVSREAAPLDWATIHNNVGNALATIGERESGILQLREAVATYRLALEVRTRVNAPFEWAMTQNNLGNALRILGGREAGTAPLEEALAAYRLALEEIPREKHPLTWATTESNLGVVLWTLGERESDTSRLQEAIGAFQLALTEITRESAPFDWAMTQNNLGTVLQTLGERESGTGRLQDAVVAYELALKEVTRESTPLYWATILNNLGNALRTLGGRENGTARLEEAIGAYRLALEEFTRERMPPRWAATQNNLGLALTALGLRESGTARLQEAVTAHQLALEEITRESAPIDWGRTLNNLGTALRGLGAREGSTARLEEAIGIYRLALEEITPERMRPLWATTRSNLGMTLAMLGAREGGTTRLNEAVAAYQDALKVTRDSAPFDWANTQNSLGMALSALGERLGGSDRSTKWLAAIEAWQQALHILTKSTRPDVWASIQNARGYQYVLLGEHEGDGSYFRRAVPILRNALAVQEGMSSSSVPFTQDSLCHALLGVGRTQDDKALLFEARSLCQNAIVGQRSLGASTIETEANLAAIDAALAALD